MNTFEIPALMGRSRGLVAPQHSTTASKSSELRGWDIDANRRFGDKPDAFLGPSSDASLHDGLIELILGMPYMSSPANAIGALVHRHPAGPDSVAPHQPALTAPNRRLRPRFPVRLKGGSGRTQPALNLCR